jgi:3-methyladenine DNA glycosylase/8-oxoguanine DNA glycosylase
MARDDKSLWEDLVVAILSVNQYSLEKAYSRIEGIRREGLSDPDSLAHWSPPEIELRLKRAGLDRGQFMTSLFADSLSSVGKYLQTAGIARCQEVLAGGEAEAVKNLLLPARGIGPKVLANFFLLRGINSKTK